METPARASPAPFPWDDAMAFGLGVLRHSSENFWLMTPRELQHASAGVYGRSASAPQHAALRNLMNLFPDQVVAQLDCEHYQGEEVSHDRGI